MPRDTAPRESTPDGYLDRVTKTVDDVTRTLQICAQRLRERAEMCTDPGQVPGIDPKFAQGLLHLAKTATALVSAYPALEGMHDDGVGEASSLTGPDAAERLRAALGGLGPELET